MPSEKLDRVTSDWRTCALTSAAPLYKGHYWKTTHSSLCARDDITGIALG
jgi:hypothetical protein